jgi:SulP family sulfate permease
VRRNVDGQTGTQEIPGLFIGIAVSFVLLLYRASRPHVAVLGHVPGTDSQYADVARSADNQPVPGVAVLRVESGLFFANADAVHKQVLAHAGEGVRAVVIDAETVPFIDVTAATMLAALAEDLARDGVTLILAREVGQVRDLLSVAEGGKPVIRTYPSVGAAVDAAGTL